MRWSGIAIGLAVLLACRAAEAQSCPRDCPAEQRDARGCCPKKPQPPSKPPPSKPPPSKPPRPQPPRPQPPPAPPPPLPILCPPGLEVSPDTDGHCCWPGQAWSKGRNQCLGVPSRCPPGMTPKTDRCDAADRDGDGLADPIDACVDAAEDPDGFADHDGCPDRDNDGDGIEDGVDQCRDSAEDVNGVGDDDGCPEGVGGPEPMPPPPAPPPVTVTPTVPAPADYGTERLSKSAMACGIVVTSLAMASTLAGIIMIPVSGGEALEMSGDPPLFLLSLVGSAVMYSIGIPLWAVGAAETERTAPEVGIGPGSFTLTF
jgi:hypothetical protein